MDRNPQAWAELGKAIREDRERQSLTRDELAARVIARGGSITTRSIASLEKGVVPKKRDKPPTLGPTIAALGWPLGAEDRILAGESPEAVLRGTGHEPQAPAAPGRSPRETALELLPSVYAFSRSAVAAGASLALRDTFDELAQRIIESIPARGGGGAALGLAAYRPHGETPGAVVDDAERILRALEGKAPDGGEES
jgi:transcriptional regulator with XRE-family HTH domain